MLDRLTLDDWKGETYAPLHRVGHVRARHSAEIASSPIGIGFEKLDRFAFDPSEVYDWVAQAGVKWARIQSGWSRTETEPGVYHWEWLDDVVDSLLRRGVQPWICLCYGNGLYDELAAKMFGATGYPPIRTDEQRTAWRRYVTALVRRYAGDGRVRWFEVWNEADGIWSWKTGVNGAEYGEFVKETAAAIRAGAPEAKVIGGATWCGGYQWLNDVFATGAASVMDALSFHAYEPDETAQYERMRALRRLCDHYHPSLPLIQGETGTQSRSDGHGALRGCAWTPVRQAKYLSRHLVSHLLHGVMFTSYFCCLDLIESLGSPSSEHVGYFGVLSGQFNDRNQAVGPYTPKPSFRTLQTLASVFGTPYRLADRPHYFRRTASARLNRQQDHVEDIVKGCLTHEDGSFGIVYWCPTPVLSTSYDATTTLELLHAEGQRLMLVDLLDGGVHELPESCRETLGHGLALLKELPLRDYPLLLTVGDFVQWERER